MNSSLGIGRTLGLSYGQTGNDQPATVVQGNGVGSGGVATTPAAAAVPGRQSGAPAVRVAPVTPSSLSARAGAALNGSRASAGGAGASYATSSPVSSTRPVDVPTAAPAHEVRIASMESSVKKFDQMLKDFKPVAMGAELQVLQQCEALAGELAEQRDTRKALEDRAKHLDKQLRHERGEREAWLVAFLTSLHTTLQELTSASDRTIADSNTLMQGSMDGTDEIMQHLRDRVDQLLIQKESELAPLTEQEELGLS